MQVHKPKPRNQPLDTSFSHSHIQSIKKLCPFYLSISTQSTALHRDRHHPSIHPLLPALIHFLQCKDTSKHNYVSPTSTLPP